MYLCGYSSAACGGKFLSDKQAVILSNYKLVVALDADEAGTSSTPDMCNKIIQYNRYGTADFVQPPLKLKDWNEFYKNYKAEILKAYIQANTRRLEL